MKKLLTAFIFVSIPLLYSVAADPVIRGSQDECGSGGSIWNRDYGVEGKWGSYGQTPSHSQVEHSGENAELFCSPENSPTTMPRIIDFEGDTDLDAYGFYSHWPRRMWHNGAVKLKLECENDPDGISGCGILCVRDGAIIPEQILITKNGEYSLCTSDKAGNAVVRKVYVNWIDWGGIANGPNSGRPGIVQQGGQKLLCREDNGDIYDGRWLNADDGDVTCDVFVKDNGGNGPDLPEIISGDIANDYLPSWYSDGGLGKGAGFSGVKKIQFTGDVFNFLNDSEKLKDMQTFPVEGGHTEFVFSDDVEKTADPHNTASLLVTDYAGNNNDANDRNLSDWVLRIDRIAPEVEEDLRCFSKPRNASLQPYTGEEATDHAYFPNGWTNTDVECSYYLVDPVSPRSGSSSRLSAWSSFTTPRVSGISEEWEVMETGRDEAGTVRETKPENYAQEQKQRYDLEGRVSDTAGNTTNFEEEFIIKIDKKPLVFGDNVRMRNTEGFRVLSDVSTAPTQFEAHEQFTLSLGIVEPGETEAPIDWEHSWMTIHHNASNGATTNPSVFAEASFANGLPSGISFNDNSQLLTVGADSEIFEVAGDYTLTFYLVDQALNQQDPVRAVRHVRIIPSEIDPEGVDSESVLEDLTATQNDLYANNIDRRELEVVLRDRFGNIIYDRDIQVIIPGQDMSQPIYDLTQVDGVSGFQEGLSLTSNISDGSIGGDSSQQVWEYNTGAFAEQSFELTSYLPSVKVIYGYGGSSMLIEETDESGEVIGQLAQFEFSAPSINPDGTENSTVQDVAVFEKSLHFKPIVYGYMTNKIEGTDGNQIGFMDVLLRMVGQSVELQFGEGFPFFAYTNTGGADGMLLAEQLPTNYGVIIQAHALSGIAFVNENYGDGEEDERTLRFCPVGSYCGGSEGSEETATHPLPSGGSIAAPKFAFSSEVRTQVGAKEVIYPGGNLGNDLGDGQSLFDLDCAVDNCPPWFNQMDITIIRVEADIEGDILGEKDDYSYMSDGAAGKSAILEMGGVSAQDIREDITRNAYQLLRGVEAQTDFNLLAQGGTFTSANNVLHFKGNGVRSATNLVKLGGSFAGVGTIVVEDANVLIDSDMQYFTNNEWPEASLGIILINSTIINGAPETGNIYVTPDVQRVVGTYFAEGSLLSAIYGGAGTIPNPAHADITGVAARAANLQAQLLITGTILTKNTLGGVLDEITGIGQNRTPWGPVTMDEVGLNEAMKYDLHWMRRYTANVPVYTNAQGVDSFACVLSGAGVCDSNRHATVIRPDGKVKTLTPPGFDINALILR